MLNAGSGTFWYPQLGLPNPYSQLVLHCTRTAPRTDPVTWDHGSRFALTADHPNPIPSPNPNAMG